MDENPTISMARARKIIRKSIHTFLQHYQYFTTFSTFIILPFSLSLLISQALIPRWSNTLHMPRTSPDTSFSPSNDLFSLVSLKLCQTISSSIITLPFSLSFLLLAKSSIIHFLTQNQKPSSFIDLYNPILSTHLCNTFILFATNATCFSLVFLTFNFLEGFHLNSPKWVLLFSIISAIFYSIILANALIICNLALISSGIERKGGFLSILKAWVLIKGKTSTALALAVPINLGLAAIEALFHLRIVANSHKPKFHSNAIWLVALEGVLIAYIYAMILVLDVIMSCIFYQSCKEEYYNGANYDHVCFKKVEECCYCDYNVEKLKGLEEFV